MPKRTSFSADDDIAEWLQDYAYGHNMSMSRFINQVLRAFMEKIEKKRDKNDGESDARQGDKNAESD